MIQFMFGLLGLKNAMFKKIMANSYSKYPAKIPDSVYRDCNVKLKQIAGRAVWFISPKNVNSKHIMLYLHGGAFYANLSSMHWQWIQQLAVSTHATLVVPDYPLAPENNCETCYAFIDRVYDQILTMFETENLVFMGDSAGATLALGLAQYVATTSKRQPKQIVLFSPWLDADLLNPEIVELDKRDKILNIDALKFAAKQFAHPVELPDYRLSPINGAFASLGEITVFVGTNEIFLADCRLLGDKLSKQGIRYNYFEYPRMFHDWIIVKQLPQTKQVLTYLKNYFEMH